MGRTPLLPSNDADSKEGLETTPSNGNDESKALVRFCEIHNCSNITSNIWKVGHFDESKDLINEADKEIDE